MEDEVAHDGKPMVHPETLGQWHDWLAAHHDRGRGVWVASWRTATGRPAVGYEDLVLEALAWGWIDSTAGTVDAERSRLWFTPRKPTSGWARTNKARVARLTAEGRMQPAGQAALDLAHANGAWTLLDDVEDLVVPPDLVAALDARPGARQHWESWPPSVRKQVLTQLVTARRPETRAARVEKYADLAAAGTRP